MKFIHNIVTTISNRSRKKRALLFQHHFKLDNRTIILDLGSENGANIHKVLNGTKVNPQNVYIADINNDKLIQGEKRYGYRPVLIPETGILPFEDNFFDIIFCSSVIEHVTIPKNQVWKLHSSKQFKDKAFERQKEFSREICRGGKQYFVQTPYKFFPIESHTWLPMVGYLPRPILLSVLSLSNRVWIKETSPDWHLLNKKQMKELFPDAKIITESMLGMTKSIMAIRKS